MFNRMVSSAWSVGHCLNQCQYLLQGTSFCPTSFSVSATSPTTLFPPVSYAVYLSYSLHSSTYDESMMLGLTTRSESISHKRMHLQIYIYKIFRYPCKMYEKLDHIIILLLGIRRYEKKGEHTMC